MSAVGARLTLPLSFVWVATVVTLPVAVVASFPLVAVDLTYLVRAGDIMLDGGTILRTDPFLTWANGGPWLNQQWATEILFGGIFRIGGWLGLATLRAALQAAILWFVYLGCRAGGAERRTAAFLTLGSAIVIFGGFGLRAQLLGMTSFAATAWLIERSRTRPTILWWTLPIEIVWANTHGSFFLGPLLLFLAAVQAGLERRSDARRLGLFALGATALTLVGPFGLQVWRYVWDVGTDPQVVDVVREWRPPSLRTVQGILFFASSAGVVGFLAVRRPAASVGRLIRLAVFFFLALTAIRASVWWGLLIPMDLAALLPAHRPSSRDHRSPINALLASSLVLLVIASMLRWVPHADRGHPGELLERAPQGVTTALRGLLEPGERYFNPQEWGSWFELALPDNPVVADSRFEVMPPARWDEYLAVAEARADWRAILDRWGIRVLALSRDQQSGLIPFALADPDWRLVYEDDEGLVLVRA